MSKEQVDTERMKAKQLTAHGESRALALRILEGSHFAVLVVHVAESAFGNDDEGLKGRFM